jgi:hypothetical protein
MTLTEFSEDIQIAVMRMTVLSVYSEVFVETGWVWMA